jgi:hypothetical protein
MPAPNGLTEGVVAALAALPGRSAATIAELTLAVLKVDDIKARMRVTTTLRRLVAADHARSPERGKYALTALGRRELIAKDVAKESSP